MSNFRAKFKVTSVLNRDPGGENHTSYVTMSAVYANGKENKEWSKWTPSGALQMSITNPEIEVLLGAEYYLNFTVA
ncbi:MAG: hypothetical protein ACEQSB_00200 [Undibacterium sp.]